MTTRRGFSEVQSWGDVPAFKDEAEEAAYWRTHRLGGAILDRMGPADDLDLPPVRSHSRAVSIRFPDQMLVRVKALAEKRGTPYQTFIKGMIAAQLVVEGRPPRRRSGHVKRSAGTIATRSGAKAGSKRRTRPATPR